MLRVAWIVGRLGAGRLQDPEQDPVPLDHLIGRLRGRVTSAAVDAPASALPSSETRRVGGEDGGGADRAQGDPEREVVVVKNDSSSVAPFVCVGLVALDVEPAAVTTAGSIG